MSRQHSLPLIVVALMLYAACLVGGYVVAHSVSGWLVWGVAPALLLDKALFRLLPWAGQERPLVAACIRAAYVLGGAAWAVVLTDGNIAPGEAVRVGIVLSLLAFLFETTLECLVAPWGAKIHESAWQPPGALRWLAIGVLAVVPLAVLYPLTLVHLVHRLPEWTPEHLQLPYEDVVTHTADGVRLRGWAIAAPQPRGVVVFFHAYGENRGQVLSLARPLWESGISVVAFDFRGHGESQGHTITFGDRERHDVAAACAFARQRFPDEPLFVVGVSYGAAVAVQALPHVPGVRAAWLDSPFESLQHVLSARLSFLPGVVQHGLKQLTNHLVWVDCGFRPQSIRPAEALQQLRLPLGFCHCETDSRTPIAESKAMYAAYPGPKVHYWIEADTPQTRGAPGRRAYFERLLQFLESHLDATPPAPQAGAPPPEADDAPQA
jgi:dienelactone hydrolase